MLGEIGGKAVQAGVGRIRPAVRQQPAIKWEEQALEVLHNGAEVGLNLHF